MAGRYPNTTATYGFGAINASRLKTLGRRGCGTLKSTEVYCHKSADYLNTQHAAVDNSRTSLLLDYVLGLTWTSDIGAV